MASARRKSAGGRSAGKAKPASKAKVKPARKSKPAVKAKPAPKAKPAAKRKPVAKAKAAPARKPVAKAARPAPKAAAKKPAPRAAARPAPKPLPPAKPVRKGPPRLVPATAEARAKAAKPATGKSKLSSRGPAEVRPLGVLPPESMAKPRHAAPRPAPAPARGPRPGAPAARPAPARKGEERLGPEDLKHFEARLLAERVRIMREMGHIEANVLKVNPRDSAGELSGYSFHMADAGTDSMEREKAFDIASKEGRLLMEIDDALRRLYGGTYGICEASGRPISRARLEALPWARRSLEEQEKLEREQRAGRLAPGAE